MAIREAPPLPPAGPETGSGDPLATLKRAAARLPLRRILAVLATGLAVLGAGFSVLILGLLLTRDFSAVPAQLSAKLERETGGTVRIGKAELRYWPRPQIIIEDIAFERREMGLRITATRGILRLHLMDLIDGSVDVPDLTLQNAFVRLPSSDLTAIYASPRGLTGLLEAVTGSFSGLNQLSGARITLDGARVAVGIEGDPQRLLLEPVNARLRYRANAGRIDFTARRDTPNRPVEISASLPTRRALQGGAAQSASIHLSGFGSRASFSGTLRRKPDLSLQGNVDASIQNDFERLVGITLSRADGTADQPTRITGSLAMDPRGGGLEALSIRRADGALTGIAAIRENAGRWNISATLAGDLVDGTAASASLQRLRTTDGTWSHRDFDVNPAPAIDLDIRLSTKAFRLGKVALENAALSILTRRDRAEFAINDARYAGGTVKARLSVVRRERGMQDVRLQLVADKVEAETVFEQAFGITRLRGPAHLVLQAESSGESIAEITTNLAGTGSLEMRGGQVLGIDANRLMTRAGDARPEAALVAALGGRTPFDQVSIHFAMRQGRVEPVGATLMAPRMSGQLEGAIDLPAQRNDLSIILRRREDQPPLPSEFFAFRIEGPLLAPQFRSDPSLLARRS
ncbi:AsmA-like C-terminal region-containing protein [Rhabdaerophilum sp.]|uniref:AsmA family protein n=1 Tax=Rhabdaerophilum sp. TaxID=2717341 RepID=UPI0038D3F4BE